MLFLEEPFIHEEERVQRELKPPDSESFNKIMSDLIVFEHLIFFPSLCNQGDLENILIKTDQNWKVWLVDLSTAFAPALRLIEGCEITACSDNLFLKLENLTRDRVRARLGQYLKNEEISALLVRKDLIIKKVKELRAKKIN